MGHKHHPNPSDPHEPQADPSHTTTARIINLHSHFHKKIRFHKLPIPAEFKPETKSQTNNHSPNKTQNGQSHKPIFYQTRIHRITTKTQSIKP